MKAASTSETGKFLQDYGTTFQKTEIFDVTQQILNVLFDVICIRNFVVVINFNKLSKLCR